MFEGHMLVLCLVLLPLAAPTDIIDGCLVRQLHPVSAPLCADPCVCVLGR